MLEKIPDKEQYVSMRINYVSGLYKDGTISLKEYNQSIRLIMEVFKKRYYSLIK